MLTLDGMLTKIDEFPSRKFRCYLHINLQLCDNHKEIVLKCFAIEYRPSQVPGKKNGALSL